MQYMCILLAAAFSWCEACITMEITPKCHRVVIFVLNTEDERLFRSILILKQKFKLPEMDITLSPTVYTHFLHQPVQNRDCVNETNNFKWLLALCFV